SGLHGPTLVRGPACAPRPPRSLGRRRTPGSRARRFVASASCLVRGRCLAEPRGPAPRGTGSRKRVRAMLYLQAEANGPLVISDSVRHTIVLPASGRIG